MTQSYRFNVVKEVIKCVSNSVGGISECFEQVLITSGKLGGFKATIHRLGYFLR